MEAPPSIYAPTIALVALAAIFGIACADQFDGRGADLPPQDETAELRARIAELEAALERTDTQEPRNFITMYSMPGCRPCVWWQRRYVSDVLDRGIGFRKVELTKADPDWPKSFPSFRYVTSDGRVFRAGNVPLSELLNLDRED